MSTFWMRFPCIRVKCLEYNVKIICVKQSPNPMCVCVSAFLGVCSPMILGKGGKDAYMIFNIRHLERLGAGCAGSGKEEVGGRKIRIH